MPPATGFQYTPPSYLLRASDTTNRPWSQDLEEEDSAYKGDNEYDLPQEDRPQTRRESHMDAHFQQRVRNKQNRYRDILKGESDVENSSSHTDPDGDDEEDSVLAAARNADSYNDLHTARLHVQSANHNELARKSRKERITGIPKAPRRSSSQSDAETARSLRAQRLRSSLLKQTPDEYETQTNLELRRLQRKQEEAAARKAEREQAKEENRPLSEAEKRKAMEKERAVLKAEREALAIAKEEAAQALQKAAELNEERIRQRELNARLEQDRMDYDKVTRRRERALKSKNSSRRMKTKKYADSDGETLMTEYDAENDFAFLNDLQGIVRDTGLLKTCAGCFGDTDDVYEENDSKPMNFGARASAAISSVFVPDLAPSSDDSASTAGDESIRRTQEYAKYRA